MFSQFHLLPYPRHRDGLESGVKEWWGVSFEDSYFGTKVSLRVVYLKLY